MPIEQKFRDTKVIPDKYNTGLTEEILYEVSVPSTVNGVQYKPIGTAGRVALDLEYSNTSLVSPIIISNTSFPTGLQKLNDCATEKTVIFNNCQFDGGFFGNSSASNIRYIFNNCKSRYNSISFGTYNKCLVGFHMGDGFNPYKEVYVNDSYVCDLNYLETEEGSIIHSDGFQVPDSSTFQNTNIIFTNCRIEDPQFPIENQLPNCYASSCFAITPNATNGADNIQVKDCIVNGGGYSIYLTQSNKTNIILENVLVGYSHRYGMFYNSNNYTGVTLTNVIHNDFLYVSSYWIDGNGSTHISVTNDTIWWKDLIIRTNHGFRIEKIKPTYRQDKNISGYIDFSDYPIDLDIDLGVVDYFVCYDSYTSDDTQIRFVNYTETPIDFLAFKPPLAWDFVNIKKKLMIAEAITPLYTPLEYIQSTGTQYIDTGLTGKGAHTRIKVRLAKTQNGTNYLFGARTTGTSKNFSALATLSTSTSGNCRSDYNASSGVLVADDDMYITVIFEIDKNKNVTTYRDSLGNVITTDTITLADFETDLTMLLFAIRNGASISYGFERIYSAEIWEDDVAMRNYIPVLDSESIPCLYDLVNSTFNYNAGTGTFLYA